MRSIIRRVVVVATTAALLLGGGTAFAADPQPANLGNSGNADRGESGSVNGSGLWPEVPADGPHIHCVLPADDKGPFDIIIAAAHQGHTQTTGVFSAFACPGDL